MKRSILVWIAALAPVIIAAAVGLPAGAVVIDPLDDLGTLGGTTSFGYAVNDHGAVVGQSWVPGHSHAYAFEPETDEMTDLGTLVPDTNSLALGINDDGIIVGAAGSPIPLEAFVYEPAVGMTGLGTLGGTWSGASDINDQGLIVGSSANGQFDCTIFGCFEIEHAFAYDPATGEMADLGAPPDRVYSWANAVNNHGTIVGQSREPFAGCGPVVICPPTYLSFHYDPATQTMDVIPTGVNSDALDVNDSGTVVGWTSPDADSAGSEAYSYDPATGTVDRLGTLPGQTTSGARGINNDGIIVGYSGSRAFVYDPATDTMHDLGTLGGSLAIAHDINDEGVVVGYSRMPNGIDQHAFRTQVRLAPGAADALMVTTTCHPPTLTWQAPSFDGYAPVSYDIVRDGVVIASTSDTTYTDTAATSPGHSYQVVATNVAGDAPLSNTATWTPSDPFTDVTASHAACPSITWAASAGITTGYPDHTFRPGHPLTRQGGVTFLYRFAGEPAGPFPDPGFTDVAPTDPAYQAIAWAAANEITTGYPDHTFRPRHPLTRQGGVTFLYRFAGEPAGPFPDPGFTDVAPTDPAYQAIAWAAANNITTGYPDHTFRPHHPLTRQGGVTFLYRDDPGVATPPPT